MPSSGRLSLPPGTPASGWELADAVNRELPWPEDLGLPPKVPLRPEEKVLHVLMDHAREIYRALIESQQTIHQLRQENATLHYLLRDRMG